MDNQRSKIGFVGLGVMGAPMSANLLARSGRPLSVYDIDDQRTGRLVSLGAHPAKDLVEIALRCDIVFLSLPSATHLEAVILGPDGLNAHARHGQTIVDMSTSPVALVQRLAAELESSGVTFVDAPVARTRQAAIDGTLSVMVGARSAETFTALEPLFRCMATDVSYCGDVGAGALVKLLNNMIVSETVVALAEAVTVARRSGLIDPATLFEVLGKGSAGSFALENHGKKALVPDDHPTEAFSSSYMLKDLSYVLDAAGNCRVHLPAASLAHGLLSEAVACGYGENYHTSVVRVIEAGKKESDATETSSR